MGAGECCSTLCIQLFKQGQVCVDAHAMAVHKIAGEALEHRHPWCSRFRSRSPRLEVQLAKLDFA
jgi:hypothetical protein